ncbi:MAG: T9SS C-terminal target domain-containing protein [Armatimonadetes bacterium]|nr:T9SS C-terminal target domain-containing protein [Armatimonadota bacterium]
MRAVLALAALLIVSQPMSAQQSPPAIEWQTSLGGSGHDAANSIQQTSDGGYIVAGSSFSSNGDVTENHGVSDSADVWIVKLTSKGAIQWQQSLGGSDYDGANSIQQTSDGGYIVAGGSGSTDGDVSGNHGGYDYWIVKLTSTGVIQWQRSLGGSGDDEASSIQQTSDGGYIVAGSSNSRDGDVSGNHGGYDYWIVKLTSTGVIQWKRSHGDSRNDYAASIIQGSDGGYIAVGTRTSTDGSDDFNVGIVKLTDMGMTEWEKSLGGSDHDEATSIEQTGDGGYIVAGSSYSADGDASENHGSSDYWIVKLTGAGGIQWEKSLGGSGYDNATSIEQTTDGGYIVAGYSYSTDGDASGNHGYADYWITKLTDTGAIQWQRSLGGVNHDIANAITQTSDGGCVVAGWSLSNDGDVTGHHGSSDSSDYWIVKLGPITSDVQPEQTATIAAITILPNPARSSAVLRIGSDAEGEYLIELVSAAGEVVKRQSVHLGIGQQEVHLQDIEQLPAGSYEVVATRGSQPFARGRLVLLGE